MQDTMSDEATSLKRRLSEIVQCTVCLAVPRDAVLQCPEGHAVCQNDFPSKSSAQHNDELNIHQKR